MLHTRTSLVAELAARIRQLHPYAVPCVLALPAAGYLSWVQEQTRAPVTGA